MSYVCVLFQSRRRRTRDKSEWWFLLVRGAAGPLGLVVLVRRPPLGAGAGLFFGGPSGAAAGRRTRPLIGILS